MVKCIFCGREFPDDCRLLLELQKRGEVVVGGYWARSADARRDIKQGKLINRVCCAECYRKRRSTLVARTVARAVFSPGRVSS